jgi:hypothetical protein
MYFKASKSSNLTSIFQLLYKVLFLKKDMVNDKLDSFFSPLSSYLQNIIFCS